MTQRSINGPYIYFVTTNTAFRRHVFMSTEQVALLGRIIKNACRLKHFDLLEYAILPDHVHILVNNKNISASGSRIHRFALSDLMHAIKRNYSRQLAAGRIWQPRYNYRIVADEKRFFHTMYYIKFNWQKHGCGVRYGTFPFLFIDYSMLQNVFND